MVKSSIFKPDSLSSAPGPRMLEAEDRFFGSRGPSWCSVDTWKHGASGVMWDVDTGVLDSQGSTVQCLPQNVALFALMQELLCKILNTPETQSLCDR